MKPHKRARTPKTSERRVPTPPPPQIPRTSEFPVEAVEVVEMGDEFVEEGVELKVEPKAEPAVAAAAESAAEPAVEPIGAVQAVSPASDQTIPATLPPEDADIEEVRYRRPTMVSTISAQLAESMLSVAETAIGRDPAAPVMDGDADDVTRRVVESDHQSTINETGPGYTVEVMDDAAADARRRVDLAHAVAAAPDLAAAVGPLHRVAFLTRNPEETLSLPLPEGAGALVEHIDGRRTVEQLFSDSRLHARDALRITATLLRAGIIRIV